MKDTSSNLHKRLRALADNLWWTWHPELISTRLSDLDPLLWRQVEHNPVAFINQITPAQLEERASELGSPQQDKPCFQTT